MAVALPLLKRVADDSVTFVMTPRAGVRPAAFGAGLPGLTADAAALVPSQRMPSRTPGPGEQYRFHFDMRRCIGCKCCVVACNEQNGNPAAINWRRVGELEGGSYPNALRGASLDGVQPLRQPHLPQRVSGRRLHEGSGHGPRPTQRRRLHRLSVLHLELLVRRPAIQPRARRRRQMRHVPRTSRARTGAGLRERVPGRSDRDRDHQDRRLARRGGGQCRVRGRSG